MWGIANLIRPQLLTLKNTFRHASRLERLRTVLFATASIVLGCTSYIVTATALAHHTSQGTPLSLEFPTIFTTLLNVVCVTALATGIVSALNSLFLGRDIDTILPAPIPRSTLLGGKILTLTSHIGWSLCVVGLPPIFAYGASVDAPPFFFGIAPLFCLILLLEVMMLAAIIALIAASCIPQRRGRYLVLIVGIIALITTTGYISTRPESSLQRITHSTLAGTFSRYNSSVWCPSTYVTRGIIGAAQADWPTTCSAFAILGGVLLSTWLLLIAADRTFYQRGLEMCQTTRSASLVVYHPFTRLIARCAFPGLPSFLRAIISKEYRSFARDLVHAVQLALIITLSLFFLTVFRVLQKPQQLSPLLHQQGEILLLACNIFLSSFVVLSICARFVFPSISLERDNFWILQSAPITSKHILQAKCAGWFLPLAIIAITISCSGAMALGTSHVCILLSGLMSIIVTYGLVGLGIGVGAVYKHSTWEYEAQLGTSLGSFVYIGLGLLGITVQTIPVILLFALCAGESPLSDFPLHISAFCAGIIILLALVNFGIRSIALRVGARMI